MRDYLSIGSTPAEEDCAQVGSADYGTRARRECTAFVNQLRRQFGPEPEGCELRVKGSAHDHGTYYEVWCFYDSDTPEGLAYALKCEGSAATEWDDEARKELAPPAPPKRTRAALTVGAVLEHKVGPAPKVRRWLGPIPACDFCGQPGSQAGFIDGATQGGPWASMCPRCHAAHGVGLGAGRGQEYDRTGVKVDG